MTSTMPSLTHELVSLQFGRRSQLPIIIARHSTALGPALGGCRLWRYPTWQDGLADALRLAEAMTLKNSAAGLNHGGGKTVIALGPDDRLDDDRRRAVFLDLGDAIELMCGSYIAGEDVGTTEHDMAVIAERTSNVVGLPAASGGAGEPAGYTALGVYESMRVSIRHALALDNFAGLRITISGVGQVGARLASMLADAGADLTLSDINQDRRTFAQDIGAKWIDAGLAHTLATEVFVPAGLGGLLTSDVIASLDAKVVVGPANNPLAERSGAKQLATRGILYAPDFIVNAGGVMYLARTLAGDDESTIGNSIRTIGDRLDHVFVRAHSDGITPLVAAELIAGERIAGAPAARAS